ncbi:MAG: hypothetical protein IKC32_04365 [Clostridia bacterium]|nr:hypothetical protein [Clostridia bacterium]
MEDSRNLITIRAQDGAIIKLEAHTVLESTSALAKRYAGEGYPDRYIVFSDKKALPDGGYEDGIYMSILLRPSIFPSQAQLLSAMAATAMVTALGEHTDKRLGLGWVSDLYCEGVRIGGCDIEAKLDNFTSYEYIIVNYAIRIKKKDFPPRLTDMIREVFESDNTSILMIMAKTILAKFFALYVNIKTSSRFMDVYSEKFIQRGIRIRYTDGVKRHFYRILNVDSKSGSLVLEGPHGMPIKVTSPRQVTMPKRIRLKKTK